MCYKVNSKGGCSFVCVTVGVFQSARIAYEYKHIFKGVNIGPLIRYVLPLCTVISFLFRPPNMSTDDWVEPSDMEDLLASKLAEFLDSSFPYTFHQVPSSLKAHLYRGPSSVNSGAVFCIMASLL